MSIATCWPTHERSRSIGSPGSRRRFAKPPLSSPFGTSPRPGPARHRTRIGSEYSAAFTDYEAALVFDPDRTLPAGEHFTAWLARRLPRRKPTRLGEMTTPSSQKSDRSLKPIPPLGEPCYIFTPARTLHRHRPTSFTDGLRRARHLYAPESTRSRSVSGGLKTGLPDD